MSFITSTKTIESTIQSKGAQRIQVAFKNHIGHEHRRQYDFPKNADIDKEIQTRKSHVEQGLKDQEIEWTLGRIEAGKTFGLRYASDEELKLRLQERELEKQSEINKLTSEKDNISMEVARL